ncbi:MAG: protein translocase subunit SecF [Actinomycetota bacterium]
MSWLRKLSRGETNIDFVGKRTRWWRISLAAVSVSLLSLVIRDLNLGVEFRGGLNINAANSAAATVEDLREAARSVGVDESIVQLVNDGASVRVQTPSLAREQESALIDRVAEVTGTDRAEISIDAVGPTFGALILRQSLLALLVFLVAVTAYMTWRLEWKMAMAGMAALFHDLIITVGVYSITGFEVTPATVIAVLTILGYSLYDTVVVFDKVSELAHEQNTRMTYAGIVNRAMNMVLGRSLNTSLTSLLPVGSVLVVGSFLLGASTLNDFALALFVGLAASTYSSIFVAAPLLAAWKERDEEWGSRQRRAEDRATARSDVDSDRSPTAAADGRQGQTWPGGRPRPPKGKR